MDKKINNTKEFDKMKKVDKIQEINVIQNSMLEIKELTKGNIPPWIRRFIKETGRGINEHKMFGDNEKILLGISGGKDSLAMALALSLRKKWLPIDYQLKAVMINWREYPISENYKKQLEYYFQMLEIPFEILNYKMEPESYKTKFNCYFCARNRRRILFEYMEKNKITKLCFGHHLDDLAETTLLNLFHRAKFETMEPISNFFDGKIQILRPMCRVKENTIIRLNEYLHFPILNIECPYKEKNIRSDVKKIVKDMCKIDKLTREHIYNAHFKN